MFVYFTKTWIQGFFHFSIVGKNLYLQNKTYGLIASLKDIQVIQNLLFLKSFSQDFLTASCVTKLQTFMLVHKRACPFQAFKVKIDAGSIILKKFLNQTHVFLKSLLFVM